MEDKIEIGGATPVSFAERPITWKEYSAFRKSMCRPFPGPVDFGDHPKPSHEAMDFLNEAIHELVGEVAEMSQIFEKHGKISMLNGERDCLIDECGDILFCADWVLGLLYPGWNEGNQDSDGVEIIEVDPLSPVPASVASLYSHISGHLAEARSREALDFCFGEAVRVAYTMMMEAGLLCNQFKKLRYRNNKKYNVTNNVAGVFRILSHANMILVLVGSSVREAMEVNIEKLVGRYPTRADLKAVIGVITE